MGNHGIGTNAPPIAPAIKSTTTRPRYRRTWSRESGDLVILATHLRERSGYYGRRVLPPELLAPPTGVIPEHWRSGRCFRAGGLALASGVAITVAPRRSAAPGVHPACREARLPWMWRLDAEPSKWRVTLRSGDVIEVWADGFTSADQPGRHVFNVLVEVDEEPDPSINVVGRSPSNPHRMLIAVASFPSEAVVSTLSVDD